MGQIHILDGQHSTILQTITAKNILADDHYKSLKDQVEKYEFTTLIDAKYASYLGKHNRVVIPDEDIGHYMEFVITEVINDGLELEVHSFASWNLLKKAGVISPRSLVGATSSTATAFALSNTIWQPGIISFAGSRTIHIPAHTNPYQLLKKIASEFGLELKFRIEVEGNKVKGRYVDLVPRIGGWKGHEVSVGKDLLSIKRKELTENLVTALHGLGPEREDGTRLEVVVEDKDALARWGEDGRHLMEIYEPETEDQNMSMERLTQLTQIELNKRVNALVEYEGDILDLEHLPGLENKKIRFGDTIRIKDTKFTPPLYLEARIHTMNRSIKKRARKQVTLGDYIEYTEEQVNALWKSLQAQINRKASMADVLEVTYTKPEVDTKANTAKEEAIETAAVDATEKANNAENKAKEHAEEKAQEAENRSKEHADVKAEEALRLANERLVETKELLDYQLDGLNNQVGDLYSSAAEIENSLLAVSSSLHSLSGSVQVDVNALHNRADSLLQRVNEQEFDMLNVSGRVVSVEQHIDTLTGQMNLTINQLSNLDGVVSDQSVSLQAHAGLIEGKASQTSVNSLTGRVTSTEGSIQAIAGQVSLKANVEDVYTKSEMNTELGKKVDTTIYTHKMSQLDVSISGIQGRATSIENEVSSVGSRMTTAEGLLSVQAGLIEAKAERSEVTTVDGKVTGVRNDLTILQVSHNGLSSNVTRIEGKVDSIGRWTSTYRVNAENPLPLLESNGTLFNDEYTYQVTARVFGTGTNTNAIAIFKSNRAGTSGSGWTLEVLYQIGTSSNHPQFFINEDGRPSIKLYSHASFYQVEVTHEKVRGRENVNSVINQFATRIDQKADSIQQSVTSINNTVTSQGSRLATAEASIITQAGQINLKANALDVYTKGQVDTSLNGKANQSSLNTTNNNVANLTNRISSAEAELAILPGEINLKANVIDVYTKSQTNAELANKADASTVSALTNRVETAESELSVQATAINQRVTTTTYNAGIASKENAVVKQNTAPSHSNGRLWLDTSKTPNVLMRSTGTAWVKASPTTAAEVGAYSSMEGSSLAGRITTAETTLNLLPGQLSAKASQIEVSDLTGRVSTAESTLDLLPGQLNAKVEKDGIIAAFNMSPEAIKLQADRIELVGAVTVLSDITGNLGDMTAGTINGVVINGSEINGGRFATTQGSTTVVIQDGYVLNVADINNITAHPRAYMQDGFFMARSAGTRELTQYAPHQLIHEHLDGQRYTLKSNAGINVDASLAVLKESVFHATPIMQFGNTSDLSVSRSRIIAHDYRYTNQAGQLTSVVASIALENYNTGGTGWFDVESRRHVGFTFYTRNNGSWTTAFRIDPAGNFFAAGSKSAVVQTENYGKRAMYAYEGTQNWFFDMMERKLEAGKWFIELNPMFQETIAEEFFVKVYEQNPCSVRLIKREAKGFWIMVETTEPYAEVVFEVYGLRRGYEYDYMNSIEEEAA
ncbi:hypothetical protein M3936_16330 [Sutcliffiella horikoshii]|uniref:phage tail spike protein n=1 Tax=Sutcliffiella horikoshii TaxID=79883 RepID=UPI00203E2659|nr:hypothetical protein [Sutcliffiella horikoshii]